MENENEIHTKEEVEAEPSEARKALVNRWLKDIEKAKAHHEKAFKRMKDDMKFAYGDQWPSQVAGCDDHRYVCNITLRHINQRVASLYAKNPTVVAKRRKTLDFTLWDEKQESLLGAIQGAMQDPALAASAQMLIQEIDQVKAKRQMLDKMGKTLEILMNHYMTEAEPNFKVQAKQLIRRVETTGVGYLKLGYQRIMDRSPDDKLGIADLASRIATLKAMKERADEGEIEKNSAEMEELETALQTLTKQSEYVLREGLVFSFPASDAIIIDPRCIQLKGFIGADWIAQEYEFTSDQIHELYDVDISGSGTEYFQNSAVRDQADPTFKVYEIYVKRTGQMMTVCEGHKDFLDGPTTPRVDVDRFWPIFALTFNDIEAKGEIYPKSDAALLRPMQIEHNRARESLREHRIANRPLYMGPRGVLNSDELDKLQTHNANEFIQADVPSGTNIAQVIQGLPKIPIDPAVYDTSMFFDDIQKSVGAQEADFGGVSGAAATEISVAEGARMSTIQSNVDDLDDFLSEMARAAGQIMLKEVSQETAKKIAGVGAVWPELTSEEIAEELYLEIEAGSSGRPNQAHDLANLERIAPYLMQLPGLNPSWLVKLFVSKIDNGIDLTDAIMEGAPSVTALNGMKQIGTGDPATDPNAQGGMGGQNSPAPEGRQAGPQPAFPDIGARQ